MNCFEWQNQSSDYLDGALSPFRKKEADTHMKSCLKCSKRLERYQALIHSLSSQPSSPREAGGHLVPLDLLRRERPEWKKIPWYIRIPIEGSFLAFLILAVVTWGPPAKRFLDRKLNPDLDLYTNPLQEFESPLDRQRVADSSAAKESSPEEEGHHDEFMNEEEGAETPAPVGGAKGTHLIWRFNLKTGNPQDYQPRVEHILKTLKVAAKNEELHGKKFPGGIQFNLVLPANLVPELKKKLEELSALVPKNTEEAPAATSPDSNARIFTWYQSQSKVSTASVPSGKTRVLVWLPE